MTGETAQLALYLVVVKMLVGAVGLYIADKKEILDLKTFLVIAFLPGLSVIYVLMKSDSSEEGISLGAWVYVIVLTAEAAAVTILRTQLLKI